MRAVVVFVLLGLVGCVVARGSDREQSHFVDPFFDSIHPMSANDGHDGSNIVYPFHPVDSYSFNLWGDKSYSAYGYMDHYRAPPVRLTVEFHIDVEAEIFVFDHEINYHYCEADKCTMSLLISQTGCTVLGGVWGAPYCTWRVEVNYYEQAGNASTCLVTDDREYLVETASHGNKFVQLYRGVCTDMHVSPTYPIPGRKSSLSLEKFTNGNLEGIIRLYDWVVLFNNAPSITRFGAIFDTFDLGTPDPAKFAKPSWYPTQAFETLPVYRY